MALQPRIRHLMQIMKKRKTPTANSLTPRLRQVVRLASLGCTLKDMGAILGISPNTADNHRTRAMKALGVDRTALLTRAAIKLRVSPLNDQLTAVEKRKMGRRRKAKRAR
jgi:DNA-binding CsgD family transcriptional regulator